MRRAGFGLAGLLGLVALSFVLKWDDSAPEQSTKAQSARPSVEHRAKAKLLNWTNSAVRFPHASVVEQRERFDAAGNQRAIIELVKIRSKHPFIRVETPFAFHEQAQGWIPLPPIEYVADQVMIEMKAGVTEQQLGAALERIEGRIIQRHPAGDSTLVLVALPKPAIDAVANAIDALGKFGGLFDVVEPHVIRRASAVPNDPEFSEQWALQSINAPAAWDIHSGSGSVVVAVVDSGIDFNHPDLATRIWSNPGEIAGNRIDDDGNGYVDDYRGINFAYGNSNPYDDNIDGHGTFVSGLIGAAANNGAGIAGVCWNVQIMPVKVIDYDGFLYVFDEVLAYDYARLEGVKIINASLGGRAFSQSEYNAIARLRAAGVLLVAAAGNDNDNNDLRPIYPASHSSDNIIAVTYSDSLDRLSPNANYGATSVDLAAPGVSVYSTVQDGFYQFASGSSFAAPHVTGVAALLKARNPNQGYTAIRAAILNHTDPRPGLSGKTATGGRLNAYEALIPKVPLAEALDSGSLVWQTGGNRGWIGQRLASADGVDSARCGNISHSQTSWLQTTVTGPGRLSFDWRVSSESNWDFLRFAIDGQVQTQISGESGWQQQTLDLTSGTHTLQWFYSKDAGFSSGEDRAWLDRVSYVRDSRGPTIDITSPAGTDLYATDVELAGTCWDALGVSSLEYRVSNIAGTGSWLPAASTDNFATWQVQLSNLALGTNIVRFRAVDVLNQVSSLSRAYVVLSPLTVNVSGCGSVNAKYAGTTWQQAGKKLTIRATPCAGNLFTHWSGDITSSNGTLSFVMQSNLTLHANFVVNPFGPVTGTYNGLFHETAGVLHESSGWFRMTLTETGAFSGSIVSDGATNKFSSRFDAVTGSSSFAISRKAKAPVQASLQLGFNNQLTGQLSDGVWTADLLADRTVFGLTNLAPFAGLFTLVFPGAADFTNSPGGHGCATATVKVNGRVSIDGRMADNTRVRQSVSISENGDWPFYAPLYAGSKGSALGWFKLLSPAGFTNQLMSWIRPPMPMAAQYPNGFSNELSAIGSPYVIPPNNRVIDCTNALLILNGADFVEPLTNQMVLTTSNVLNIGPYNVSMKVVRTNGTFTGRIIQARRTNTFRGVFLQRQNIGLGYFIGSNYVGEVRFEPVP